MLNHANLIVCESVLSEKTGVVSAIRIMDLLVVAPNGFAHFFTLTRLYSSADRDISLHTLNVQAVGPHGVVVASSPPHPFVYGYGQEPSSPGGFMLTTEFSFDGTAPLGPYDLQAFLDNRLVARAALTLRKL